jgi:hypothetical protein
MSRMSAVGYRLIVAAKAHRGIIWMILGEIDYQGPGAESFKRILRSLKFGNTIQDVSFDNLRSRLSDSKPLILLDSEKNLHHIWDTICDGIFTTGVRAYKCAFDDVDIEQKIMDKAQEICVT